MTLFLIISFLLVSCGNGGPIPKEGQAATADGTIIDLGKVSEKIRNTFDFVTKSEEVKALVKSIDELAKGIGKKIESSGSLGADTNKNTALMAGVYSVGLDIVQKAKALKNLASIKDGDLEQKVTSVISASESFVNKLKGQHSDLGASSGATTDTNAQNAIDKNDRTGGKGKEELVKLNTAIDELLKVINGLIKTSVTELTSPAKKEGSFQS